MFGTYGYPLHTITRVESQVPESNILFPILPYFLLTHDDGCLDKSEVSGRQMADPPERDLEVSYCARPLSLGTQVDATPV